ncbi:uncharacterized protein LOC117171434 [Belonocnema kinseyi]|uniref:uncharacterized protein LOC117171434 n=1 Tax=Belonocnema kinseyi TaxID=2817044 RepID=UPI00143D921E|nr:uncharacterized protein LOC117171434 [Belonocnema kinseyi]
MFKHSMPELSSPVAVAGKTKVLAESHHPANVKKQRKIFPEPRSKSTKNEKLLIKISPISEGFRTFQALLLVSFVLALSYHGIRYGRTEYSLLENGKTVNGFISAHKKVVTLSLGYSVPYSIISSIAALMLIFSLISKSPRWSLPSIILSMADLVCDVGDALVASWLFFGNLQFSTALFYTACTAFIVLGELWVWLGVLRLYEYRTFK